MNSNRDKTLTMEIISIKCQCWLKNKPFMKENGQKLKSLSNNVTRLKTCGHILQNVGS